MSNSFASSQPTAATFWQQQQHGFLRIALATPLVHLTDVAANLAELAALAEQAVDKSAAVLLTPELSLTGYSLDDLVQQDHLLAAAHHGLIELMAKTKHLPIIQIVGLPVCYQSAIFNVAAVIGNGRCYGLVCKSYLPNYREYYEQRNFSSGLNLTGSIPLGNTTVPIGTDLLFELPGNPLTRLAVEICEDAWVAVTPGLRAALAGAVLIMNPSASNITINKAQLRRRLVREASFRGRCCYCYSAAGFGESTTDLAWDGQGIVAELGEILLEQQRYQLNTQLDVVDVDVATIARERRLVNVFADNARQHQAASAYRIIPVAVTSQAKPTGKRSKLLRPLNTTPYVPRQPQQLDQVCAEVYAIQTQGLMRRMQASKCDKLVIGVSGGIDSAHALLIANAALARLQLPAANLSAWYLKSLASTAASRRRARQLVVSLGLEWNELNLTRQTNLMLRDLNHPAANLTPQQLVSPEHHAKADITFENIQAGLRSDYLFRIANQQQALVVGTGDLSELALGWCTYGVGDQMAHYNVNASLAKTLIQFVMRWVSDHQLDNIKAKRVIAEIINAKITPELIPGNNQDSEKTLGSYVINDFFLYYTLRFGYPPAKLLFLASHAFNRKAGQHNYSINQLLLLLDNFYQRFFSQQFKRTAAPNAPKTAFGGSLSPRGDWRAPADITPTLWRKEVARLKRLLVAK